MAKPVRIALLALVAVALLFLFVFPTRSYLSQRERVAEARRDVTVLREQNERLEQESARLRTPAEIERLAREQFHYVYPGERAFAVVPAEPAETPDP